MHANNLHCLRSSPQLTRSRSTRSSTARRRFRSSIRSDEEGGGGAKTKRRIKTPKQNAKKSVKLSSTLPFTAMLGDACVLRVGRMRSLGGAKKMTNKNDKKRTKTKVAAAKIIFLIPARRLHSSSQSDANLRPAPRQNTDFYNETPPAKTTRTSNSIQCSSAINTV